MTTPVLGFAVTEPGRTKGNFSNADATRRPHWIGQCIPLTSTTTRGAFGSTEFVGRDRHVATIPITATPTTIDGTHDLFRLVGLLDAEAAGMKGISANAVPVASSAFGDSR